VLTGISARICPTQTSVPATVATPQGSQNA